MHKITPKYALLRISKRNSHGPNLNWFGPWLFQGGEGTPSPSLLHQNLCKTAALIVAAIQKSFEITVRKSTARLHWEPVDGVQAFGIQVFDYLVLPRIIALIAMMPLLGKIKTLTACTL